MTRCYNFCAGPATLPLPVLEKAREETARLVAAEPDNLRYLALHANAQQQNLQRTPPFVVQRSRWYLISPPTIV